MSDHQTDVITHLREVIKEIQSKLEYRTQMLAYILPHMENQAHNDDYIAFEFCEKFAKGIEQFKHEYEKEIFDSK